MPTYTPCLIVDRCLCRKAWYQVTSKGEPERIEAPLVRDFWRSYVRPLRPVILRGLVDDWGARQKWTLEYLAGHCGEQEIPIRVWNGDKPTGSSQFFKSCDKVPHTINQFMELISSEPGDNRYYVSELGVLTHFPRLKT